MWPRTVLVMPISDHFKCRDGREIWCASVLPASSNNSNFSCGSKPKICQQPESSCFAPNLVHVAGVVQAVQTLEMYQFHFQKLKLTPRIHIISSRYEPDFYDFWYWARCWLIRPQRSLWFHFETDPCHNSCSRMNHSCTKKNGQIKA